MVFTLPAGIGRITGCLILPHGFQSDEAAPNSILMRKAKIHSSCPTDTSHRCFTVYWRERLFSVEELSTSARSQPSSGPPHYTRRITRYQNSNWLTGTGIVCRCWYGTGKKRTRTRICFVSPERRTAGRAIWEAVCSLLCHKLDNLIVVGDWMASNSRRQ